MGTCHDTRLEILSPAEGRRDSERHMGAERLRAILDTVADAIVTADSAGRIVGFNPSAERIFGRAEAQVLGQSLTIFMPKRFHAAHEAGLRRFMETGQARVIGKTVELEGLRADGGEFPLELSLATWEHEGERFFTGLLSDITERKRRERELVQRAQELATRTVELETANSELARSNADLEQFAYIASHDLSEPLRSVSGFVQLLKRRYGGQLDPEADRFIGFAVDGVARMQALIEDLLRYSRAGRGELHVARVDSAEVVARTVEALSGAIGEARAEIEVRDLPVVTADEAALGQVFQNLIANALKYRDGEQPRVEVSAVPDGGEWRFSVEDNGIGIEPRHAERIFQLFQRLHARESYPGAGVGLALCRIAVERHGGRIWCEPRPAGTAFHFTIPDGEERTA